MLFSAQLVLLFLLACIAGRVIYNLFLHPLRGYPGPLLCRATPLPRMYHRLKGNSPFHMHAMHKRYGDVVRVSPNELSYINSDAWRDIYGHGGTSLPRDTRSAPRQRDVEPALIGVLDNEEHRQQRQLFSPAFSNRALKEQEPMLLKHINLFVKKLYEMSSGAGNSEGDSASSKKGNSIDIVDMFNFTTFDIMGDLAFGQPLGLLENSTYTPWVRANFAGIRIFAMRGAISYYFPIVDHLMPWIIPKSLQKKRKEHMAHAEQQVNQRLARQTDRPDIWTLVLRHNEKEERESKAGGLPKLTLGQMHSNAGLFMVAGTETTATLLSGAVFLLASHPDTLARLTKEIRAAFPRGNGDDKKVGATPVMTIEALARLPFLNAVLDESLRFYPPAPDGLPRRTPAAGATVCGRYVGPDATLFVTQYAMFHSERNFARPDDFIPERWLAGETDDEVAAGPEERKVLQPFSVGPRNCLGKNLANHEMRLMLSHLLLNFDVELCEESKRWMDQKVYALWSKKPLMVRLKPAAAAAQ